MSWSSKSVRHGIPAKRPGPRLGTDAAEGGKGQVAASGAHVGRRAVDAWCGYGIIQCASLRVRALDSAWTVSRFLREIAQSKLTRLFGEAI